MVSQVTQLIQLGTPGWEAPSRGWGGEAGCFYHISHLVSGATLKGATSWELLSACLESLLGFQKDNHVTFISFGSLLPYPTPSEEFPLLPSSYTSLLGD